MGLTIRENILPNLRVRGFRAFTWVKPNDELTEAQHLTERFNVKPRDTELTIATLSGGNQQKVILSRWLSIPRSLIVLEEPTAGVDVGAKSDIYRLIHETTADPRMAIRQMKTQGSVEFTRRYMTTICERPRV